MMTEKTRSLTLNPNLTAFQADLRARYAKDNLTAQKGQIVFVGSSLMEIFPIEKWEKEQDLKLSKHIYNRGIRATTTADLLAHMDVQIFDLAPSKLFINIGTNDIGFGVPEAEFLKNYDQILYEIKENLPTCKVYLMAYYPLNNVDFGQEKDEKSLLEKRNNLINAQAGEKVAKLAEKYNAAFINVNAGLTDEQGNLKKELTFDGAHLLPEGYAIVFQNMKPYL